MRIYKKIITGILTGYLSLALATGALAEQKVNVGLLFVLAFK
ncbi:hypothetical protein P378_02765 [Desulforamulus profundi]|uniref:Uncharacterized protein n=1 Tax=Desulforamulus profundi TaxID=1383067 RepID=A0A2C6MIN7_9FIRM|nr:hypothetical protein [Desulforamulus profundi]PHJ39675.1 hypothetical protein P378_02765 [Desulforamulus profundi]